MSANIDSLIDKFVAAVNSGPREPVNPDHYPNPSSVLIGELDEYGFLDWQIKRFDNIDWVDELESRIGLKFPLTYRSLITRYIFPDFEAAGVSFFANTPEGKSFYDLRTRIDPDGDGAFMSKILNESGYLQFGQPEGGDFDPVCFDLNRGTNSDRPIMRVEHESILCDGKIGYREELAPSFRELIMLKCQHNGG